MTLVETVILPTLRFVLFLVGKFFKAFEWLFPFAERKMLDTMSVQKDANGLIINSSRVNYIQVTESNWRIVPGFLLPAVLVGYWIWLAQHDFKFTTWQVLLVVCCLLNALNFSMNLRRYCIVFWSFAFRTPVAIGDITDEKAETLAVSMANTAKAKKVKMTLINRRGIMRAYFRNAEEAVLIRASS